MNCNEDGTGPGHCEAAERPTYRLLVRGEIVERNDEWLQADAVTWEPTPPIAVGMMYSAAMLPGRRKVTPNAEVKGG